MLPDLAGSPWRWLSLSARRDLFCLVDAIDYDWLMQWRWNQAWWPATPHKLYAKRNIGPARSTLYLHRAVLKRADPRAEDFMASRHGDHINGQSLDDRRANLRWATPAENTLNRIPWQDVPSLDDIAEGLLREWRGAPVSLPPAGGAMAEIPF